MHNFVTNAPNFIQAIHENNMDPLHMHKCTWFAIYQSFKTFIRILLTWSVLPECDDRACRINRGAHAMVHKAHQFWECRKNQQKQM